MKKFFSIALNTLLVIVLIGIGGLFAAATLPIPGAIEIKIVKSGSMEPTIQTGGIVVIQPAQSYAIDDVITFGADTQTEIPTTHRIIDVRTENGTTYFTTKGDANEERDAQEIAENEVIGKVLFTAPYAGYLVDFARQPLGFILLIVVPAGLLILHEVMGIVEEVFRRKKGEKEPRRDDEEDSFPPGITRVQNGEEERLIYTRLSVMDDIYCPERVVVSGGKMKWAIFPIALLVVVVPFTAAFVGGTASEFFDKEVSAGSLLAAASLDFGVDADMPRSISLTVTGYGEEHGTEFAPYVEDYIGGDPVAYSIRSEKTGGDDAFCKALTLEGSVPVFDYSGPLLGLSTGTTTDPSPWPLLIEAYDTGIPIPDGAICMVDLVYESDAEGYSDEERLALLITYVGAPVTETNTFQSFSSEPALEETLPEPLPIDEVPQEDAPIEEPPVEEPPQEEPPAPAPEPPPSEPAPAV